MGTVNQFIAEGFDFLGNAFNKIGADIQGSFAINIERCPRQSTGLFDMLGRSTGIRRLQRFIGGRIDPVNGGAIARNRVLSDQHVARQSHGVFLIKREMPAA
jgi:hypothetical protein